jgi:hypothetical protein
MKYVMSLLLGVLAGAACAAALLYFNPLTRHEHTSAAGSDWVLSYSLSASDSWLSTHSGRIELPVVPAGVPLLWENGIKGSLLAAMPLAARKGSVGAAASRISVPSTRSEFLRAGLLVDDFWLVSVPGRGSFFVHAVNNQWPLVRDTIVRVDWLHRSWSGQGDYDPTQGPDGSSAEVIGMSGVYTGARGTGRERLSVAAYSGTVARLSGELMLDVKDATR